MATKVNNIEGTTDNTCKCGSWLAHWKKFSGQQLGNYCSEQYCTNKPAVGAHVQKDSTTDSSWYIVPLCDVHNKKASTLSIVDSVTLVSANVGATCGK